MSYRYWQKSHPTWPKKIGDVKGRKVRLLHQLETKGGEIFSEGLVMRVGHVYRGRLVLEHLTDNRAVIRKVDPFDVELLRD
jgi:hypothetical protein